MKRNPQLDLLKKQPKAYGGELLKTRKGRSAPRPLAERTTMHLVLRSSKAVEDWSFKKHDRKIKDIVGRFSTKYGVRIVSMANVGNHLHFQMKLGNRHLYKAFIRAITASIAMAVTGASRWTTLEELLEHIRQSEVKSKNLGVSINKNLSLRDFVSKRTSSRRFWDYRPFTRIIQSYKAFLNLKDYMEINQLEGFGVRKEEARFMVWDSKRLPHKYSSA